MTAELLARIEDVVNQPTQHSVDEWRDDDVEGTVIVSGVVVCGVVWDDAIAVTFAQESGEWWSRARFINGGPVR